MVSGAICTAEQPVAINTQTVVARADEVSTNTAAVADNTLKVGEDAQAVADALASIADGPVASVNGKSGVVTLVARDVLPPVGGNSGMALVVNAAGNNVEWGDVAQKVGDVLITARIPDSGGYQPADGRVRQQAQYPELFGELGFIGGKIGLGWTISNAAASVAATTLVTNNDGVWLAGGATSNGFIKRSADDGSSWNDVTAPAGVNASAMCIRGSQAIAFVTTQEMYRSLNHGVSWEFSNPFGQPLVAINAVAGSSIQRPTLFIACGASGYILRSTSGTGWLLRSHPAGTAVLKSVATDEFGVWCIAYNNGILRSEDDGLTWVVNPVAGNWNHLDTDKNGTWVVVGVSGAAARSTDNGITWQSIALGLGTTAIQSVSAGINGQWIAINNSGGTSRSLNGGANWLALPANPAGISSTNSIKVSSAGTTILGGSAGRIARSTPSFDYDPNFQFALPKLQAPEGLTAYIKCKGA